MTENVDVKINTAVILAVLHHIPGRLPITYMNIL